MGACQSCGNQLAKGAQFCGSCGRRVEAPPAGQASGPAEEVLGVVLFGGYYKDICFTDSRIIQFEVMRDRWKFLLKAAKPLPLVVESGGNLSQVLPFLKNEIPRVEVAALELTYHGRLTTGHFKVTKKSGEVFELARIDADVDRGAFDQLALLVRSVYPEVAKNP